jgi:hypothetical protein
MAQKATRREEEKQTLQKFIENQGEEFYPDLVSYLRIQEPCDVLYKEIEYQITYGDQKLIGEMRQKTAKKKDNLLGEIFCTIRDISDTYAETLIHGALENKKNKSSDKMILLIHCSFPGIYAPIEAREEKLKKYFTEHQDLGSKWQHIFIVFPDGNIKLR